jgi:adenylate kinase family enzyme
MGASLATMRRVVILGPSNAGKSTLAVRLGEVLGIPVYHLDVLYWRPGWVAPLDSEWEARLRRVIESEAWIVDGNFTQSLPERLSAADTIIYLDLPRYVCLGRALKRRLMEVFTRVPGRPKGCRPMFNLRLLRWIWTFPSDHRPTYLAFLAQHRSGKQVLVLRSRREVRRFLSSARAAGARVAPPSPVAAAGP